MRRTFYRTIKNNRVKLCNKILGHPDLHNHELDGMRFCFMPYSGDSGFTFDGLTALWGTEELSKTLHKGCSEETLTQLQDRNDEILASDGIIRWYFWRQTTGARML